MAHDRLTIALLLVLFVSIAASGEEPEPLLIKTVDQAKGLAAGTTAVYVDCYRLEKPKEDRFCSIMTVLAKNPEISYLKLRIPNSSRFQDNVLEVLRQFDSVETLELADARDYPSMKIFEQVAAMKNLKQVKLRFL